MRGLAFLSSSTMEAWEIVTSSRTPRIEMIMPARRRPLKSRLAFTASERWM